MIKTVEPWNKLNDAQRQSYAKADRVWNGWRSAEEEAYGFYRDRLPEFDAVLDASWAKWSYTSKKDEILGVNHSVKSYNVKPPRDFPLFLGVSHAHSRFLSQQLHIPVRTQWNPVDVDAIPMQRDKSERLLSLNRVMPTKGIHYFLDVCEKTKAKGDVAGDDSTLVPDQGYVNMVKQRCAKSANVVYHGLVSDAERVKLLQNAKATLCFVDGGYQEVFGMQAVESLAAGTPVIAADSWGFSDTIQDGVTGFIIKNIDEAVKRVTEVMDGTVRFDPAVCRASAERFARGPIAQRLEKTLKSVQRGCRW